MSLLSELKRRNVFRVAVMYLAVSWLVLQATDVVGSLLGLPSWAGKLVVLLLIIGFPAALVFSWLYELTPEGIRRDSAVAQDESGRRDTGRRLNLLTTAAALLAVAVIGIDRLLPERPAAGQPQGRGVAVAVLPFVSMSAEAEQEHFADGITEEILNLLANVRGLRVTSRTSAFSFKGQSVDLPTIARKLGVSHVVEGSVRKSGNSVRVAAQLIDVESDAHIWSETYEREIDNVFIIQSDIAGQIARVLSTALSADELSLIGERPTSSLGAWQNFVSARSLYRSRVSRADLEGAMAFVNSAIEEDPDFARAHALRAALLLALATSVATIGPDQYRLQSAFEAANLSLTMAPKLGEPYFILAYGAYVEGRLQDAARYFQEAIIRAPNNADGRNWYGTFLLATGYLSDAWAEKQRAAALDPLSPIISWQVSFAAMVVGHWSVVSDFAVKSRENGWSSWQPSVLEAMSLWHQRDYDELETHYYEIFPDRTEQIGKAFDAVRKRHIDEDTRRMLDGLPAYGPPVVARFEIEVHAGDMDAAFATAWSVVTLRSVGNGPEAGRAQVPADGMTVVAIQPDWWLPSMAEFRQDPRYIELVTASGLMDFWKEHGWPDLCQPVGDTIQCR
jgi:adenylate cyclase